MGACTFWIIPLRSPFSSICIHETLCHVSQNWVVVLHTLPLPLHHSRKQSRHLFGVSSISLLQPKQVLIWWKCIWLWVQNSLYNLFLLSRRSHEPQIFFYIYLCFHLQHAWSCRSTSKSQHTPLFISKLSPKHHSSWSTCIPRSWNASILSS